MAGEDAIFLMRPDGLAEMTATPYESESVLQGWLASYPDLLAGGQIRPEQPRQWVLIDRELGVPKEERGGSQWTIDHLFLDQDGVPTIVEVKRSSDTRIRREVVGQMLDYAANGVRYWPIEDLRATFERTCERRGEQPDQVLATAVGADDAATFWNGVDENLRSGRIRMVFVADHVPQELQTIVEFLNEQMERAEVLAIEIKQYEGSEQRALVPRLIGLTARARQTKKETPAPTFAERLADASEEFREVDRKLVGLAQRLGLRASEAKASRRVSSEAGGLFYLYPQWESLDLSLGELIDAGAEAEAEKLRTALSEIAGRPMPPRIATISCEAVLAHWEQLEQILTQYVSDRRKAESSKQEMVSASLSEGSVED